MGQRASLIVCDPVAAAQVASKVAVFWIHKRVVTRCNRTFVGIWEHYSTPTAERLDSKEEIFAFDLLDSRNASTTPTFILGNDDFGRHELRVAGMVESELVGRTSRLGQYRRVIAHKSSQKILQEHFETRQMFGVKRNDLSELGWVSGGRDKILLVIMGGKQKSLEVRRRVQEIETKWTDEWLGGGECSKSSQLNEQTTGEDGGVAEGYDERPSSGATNTAGIWERANGREMLNAIDRDQYGSVEISSYRPYL
ncbi:10684_t:CDS:2, partial [Acaulospora colombiana]